jgi:predicted hotdog family 3-hydroxylacyl-ACP dehydratase
MKITREQIAEIIPQKAPFVMIDNLVEATGEMFESNFTVRNENIFLRDNQLTEPALIENIAQTCAAGFASLQKDQQGEPKIGFIGGITKLQVHSLPVIHEQVDTRVTVLYQLDQVFLVKGESFCSGKMLLECEMKIVVA